MIVHKKPLPKSQVICLGSSGPLPSGSFSHFALLFGFTLWTCFLDWLEELGRVSASLKPPCVTLCSSLLV